MLDTPFSIRGWLGTEWASRGPGLGSELPMKAHLDPAMLHVCCTTSTRPGGQGKGAKRRGFGRTRRLPSARWQASYTGPDGATHNAPTTFFDEMEAESWLARERRLIEVDDWAPPRTRSEAQHRRSLSLREYADPWLEKRPLKPRTARDYRVLLDQKLYPELGDVALKHLTRERVEAWHQA